jgi:hypothetical protein
MRIRVPTCVKLGLDSASRAGRSAAGQRVGSLLSRPGSMSVRCLSGGRHRWCGAPERRSESGSRKGLIDNSLRKWWIRSESLVVTPECPEGGSIPSASWSTSVMCDMRPLAGGSERAGILREPSGLCGSCEPLGSSAREEIPVGTWTFHSATSTK